MVRMTMAVGLLSYLEILLVLLGLQLLISQDDSGPSFKILEIWHSTGKYQAVQQIVFVVFGAVNEAPAFCLAGHFSENLLLNNSWSVNQT